MSVSATLKVFETFLSIQGESTHAGRLCFFIRLAGCNLNCAYCDTVYARDPMTGSEMRINELCAMAVVSGAELVEITGGEPLCQKGVASLCRQLLDSQLEVMVETNGSFDIGLLPARVIKILDCKTPSSGEADKMLRKNYEKIEPADEVKFVIADRNDYLYARKVIEQHRLRDNTLNLIFSPAWGSLEPKQLAEWMIADRVPARMQLQLHKYIWGPDIQGV